MRVIYDKQRTLLFLDTQELFIWVPHCCRVNSRGIVWKNVENFKVLLEFSATWKFQEIQKNNKTKKRWRKKLPEKVRKLKYQQKKIQKKNQFKENLESIELFTKKVNLYLIELSKRNFYMIILFKININKFNFDLKNMLSLFYVPWMWLCSNLHFLWIIITSLERIRADQRVEKASNVYERELRKIQ